MKLRLCVITLLALFFSCAENKNTKEEILRRIALAYINANKKEIKNRESIVKEDISVGVPTVVRVAQGENYNGYIKFALWTSVGLIYSPSKVEMSDSFESEKLLFVEEIMPSRLIKVESRYIALYLNGRPAINRKDVPLDLFSDFGGFLGGVEWVVLMCENCNNFIVINNIGWVPPELIVQINDFTCDCRRRINPRRVRISVEDAIIDPVKMKEFRPPPPPPLEELEDWEITGLYS
ncbi:MAG: hypothetical protein FWC94_05240 [Bacteroidales bacterium]|nr:hypothetical protein [Bacteroidales bacterium]